MSRLLMGFVLFAAACGSHKSFESLCANQVPPPEACMTACDPASGTGDATCPGGFHCASTGKCDALCTPTGGECGNGYSCTNDGFCQQESGDDGPIIDADCPAVHFTAAKTTPTVELLIDQSGTMTAAYGGTDRWNAVRQALLAPNTGVVSKLGDKVVFGASLYSNKSKPDMNGQEVGITPCPTVTHTVDRKLNNLAQIQKLLQDNNPDEDTPTAESIDAIRADFMAHPPMQGSPPIIVLATDGLPDTCADADPPAGSGRQEAANQKSVAAAKAAYAAGIKLFFLFVGDDQAGNHPQQMANAGAGKDPVTGKEKFYTAKNPAELTAAFNEIVGGILSCDLKLSGEVDPGRAQTGTVALNGTVLTYGTDWNVDADGVTLHLLGAACNTLKTANNPTVDATFDCGSVIF